MSFLHSFLPNIKQLKYSKDHKGTSKIAQQVKAVPRSLSFSDIKADLSWIGQSLPIQLL